MRKVFFACFILFVQTLSFAKIYNSSTPNIKSYINKYSDIAQAESKRSGIPASVILAQAILESEFGNSKLCSRSNNHFGIKWKKATDGDFVYSMDDDYDKAGNHIASKFIKYKSAESSFRHHSEFLMNRAHYKPLFKYSRTNYEKWAYGLRTCGYSTDRTYGSKLIQLIHRYKLNGYDVKDENNIEKPMDNRLVSINIEKAKKAIKIDSHTPSVLKHFFWLKTQGQELKEYLEANGYDQVEIIETDDNSNDAPLNLPLSHTQNNVVISFIERDRLKAILVNEQR